MNSNKPSEFVFLNGVYCEGRSKFETSLKGLFSNHQEGYSLVLPSETNLSHPLHFIFISTDDSPCVLSQVKNKIIAQKGSTATIIESYHCHSERTECTTNVSTQIQLESQSKIEHYKFQKENKKTTHTSHLNVEQDQSSSFLSYSLAFGSKLTKNTIQVFLNAEESECTLNGVFFIDEKRQMEHYTQIHHIKPACKSYENYRGILTDASKGVFQGKILVSPDAQDTEAQQENRNILLSPNAIMQTEPQLEIHANRVKCTHGATVGQLDTQSLFYLRSRGISEKSAKNILARSFFNDLISKIKPMFLQQETEETINRFFYEL